MSRFGPMNPFGFDSTTEDVLDGVDLTGLNVLVTGVSSGLGLETARVLATHGADVTGVARDSEKAYDALDALDVGQVAVWKADLASLTSIRDFTDSFIDFDSDRIDVLICNAGIMACPQGNTADGFELQFGTNHLGHFLLVNRLLPMLLTGTPARVVVLSSAGHNFSDVSIEDPNFEQTPYDPWLAYGRSKTANVLFAVELDRRLRDRGVRATAVHPGGIITDLGRHLTDESMNALIEARGDSVVEFKSVEQGAATSVWAGFVANGDDVGGRYCEDCDVAPIVDVPTSPGVMGYALDPDTAAALWTLSDQMVGETFDP